IQPRREISLRPARPFIIAAAVVLGLLAVVYAAWPRQTAFLLTRASAPFINLPNLHARDLAVRPGDTVLAEGQRLDVQVVIPTPRLRKASLRIATDGDETAQRMSLANPGDDAEHRFVFTCPPATETFQYRAHAGDALSRYYTARVVPPPAIQQVDLRYDYPTYARRPPKVETASGGNIRALRGTKVAVTATTNKPAASAEVILNGLVSDIQPELSAGEQPTCTFAFVLSPDLAGRWALKLTDEHGFSSSSAEHLIELQPDDPPKATVLKPEEKKLTLPPTASVPVAYALEDDVGLRRAEVLIEVDGRSRPARPLPLEAKATEPLLAVTSETRLELATLKLRGAKYVTFQLRATDGLPKRFDGPQHGLSELFRIELDVRAPSFEVAKLMDNERRMRETLEKVKKDLQKAKRDSEKLKRQLPKAEEPTAEEDQRVDQMREKLADAEGAARRIAREMEDGYLDNLAQKVEDLADQDIAKAENVAGQIKLADEPAERGILARETDRLIDRALDEVDELLDQVEPVGDMVRKAIETEELARRQEALARDRLAAEQADAGQQPDDAAMDQADWQEAQQALAQDAADMLKDMPGGERAALEQAQAQAADLADQAARMGQQQEALAGEAQRLDQLQQLDQQGAQLAQEQRALAQQAADNPAAQPQAGPMNQAADNLQAGNLADAAQQQAAAEDALNQAAQQLAQQPQAGQPADAQGQQAQADQVAGLADQQADLRQRTEQLQAQRDQLVAQHQQDQMNRLQAEQAQIAQEAGDLAGRVGDAAPQPDQIENAAAATAQQAADALQANQMPQAAQEAGQAAGQLGELAQRLEDAAAQALGAQPQAPRPAGQQ
ncbi:MAG: hypothetical protein ACOC8D_03190, partial [bacterium]